MIGKHNSLEQEIRVGQWVGETHPMFGKLHTTEAKEKMRKASTGNTNRRKTYSGFTLVSPTGEQYSEITFLVGFAHEHGLQATNLLKVLQGVRLHTKGWKLVS